MEEPKDKTCIDYALHMYDILWDYYKTTLEERNRILNNYIVVVGIPISIIGIAIERVKDFVRYYSDLISLALIIILLFGIVIYDAYVVESFISERYLKQIKRITTYLIQHYDNSFGKVFSKTYSLDKIFLNRKESPKHRLKKGFLIIISNTAIIIIIFYSEYLSQIKCHHIFFAVSFSFLIHMTIFIYHEQNELLV